MLAAFKNRDYRLLFAGQAISYLGDQFHLIALPWLVLTLTHDPLQLGGVLAVAGIPRALLMLVGGAWADRHSPRLIMLASDALRFVLTAALAAAILTGNAQLWMVYVLAAGFGIVSGFFMPAAHATVPRLLESEQLESGNAAIMGVNQVASFVGPVAAGLLIAAFGSAQIGSEQTTSLAGIGIAFSVDALSFLASAIALALMHPLPAANSEADKHPLAEVTEGLRYALGSAHLRAMVAVIAIANFLIAGPMLVGLPVVASTRLSGGAAAFGSVMAAFGVGSLLGMLGAGALKRPSDRVFGWLVVVLLGAFGVTVAALGFVTQTWVAVALMFATGVGDGYVAVIAMTTLQRMTAESYLGRVMSLVTLAMVGLMPISQALAGAVLRVSPQALFVSAGVGFAVLAAWTATIRGVWVLDAVGDGAAPAVHPAEGGAA